MSMPEPGTYEWEKMVDFMRADLESGMAYTKLIQGAKRVFEEQGRDFDSEFEEWKKEKPLIQKWR